MCELRRLGARVVRVEPPEGDPMRATAPAWDRALRAGTESVTCDLRSDVVFARALCSRADVVLEGFRPGVLDAIGLSPRDVPSRVVWCSLTGFGASGRHRSRAGHDLNYLGWAGALEDTPDRVPPLPIADLAAGALGLVTEVLAALVRRATTGEGARIVISMTHRSHDLVAHRLGGDPRPCLLTGGVACYRTYETADGRWLTVAALEPKFFARLCELLGRTDLSGRQYDDDQAGLAGELAVIFASRSLTEWLDAFDGEDVCVGPVSTRAEAHADLGPWPDPAHEVPLGAHTAHWLGELDLS
jgi:crotonobetainyl-CoA:carnitine CoA-transferase CaiB-like acyl-CoA transferase